MHNSFYIQYYSHITHFDIATAGRAGLPCAAVHREIPKHRLTH